MTLKVPDEIVSERIVKGEASNMGIPIRFGHKNGCITKIWVIPHTVTAVVIYDDKGERQLNWDWRGGMPLDWPTIFTPMDELHERGMQLIEDDYKAGGINGAHIA